MPRYAVELAFGATFLVRRALFPLHTQQQHFLTVNLLPDEVTDESENSVKPTMHKCIKFGSTCLTLDQRHLSARQGYKLWRPIPGILPLPIKRSAHICIVSTPRHLHTYTLTYLHTYTLTYLHTYILTYLHTYTLKHLYTYEGISFIFL